MMRFLIPAAALAAGAAAGFVGVVHAYPRLAMATASERVLAREGTAPNRLLHNGPVDETTRNVVRPAPDLVYSICIFDLSTGPLRITSPKPADDRYASVSFYAANSDNFAVFNDRDEAFAEGLDVVLHQRGEAPRDVAANVVASPTITGIVLLRRVVEADEALDVIDAERRASACEPYAG